MIGDHTWFEGLGFCRGAGNTQDAIDEDIQVVGVKVFPGKLVLAMADIGLTQAVQCCSGVRLGNELFPETTKELDIYALQTLPEPFGTVVEARQVLMIAVDILHVLNVLEHPEAEHIKGIDTRHKVGLEQQRLLLFEVSQSRENFLHGIGQHQNSLHWRATQEAGRNPNVCVKRRAKPSHASGLTRRGGRLPWKMCTNCSAFHWAMRWRESTVTPAV